MISDDLRARVFDSLRYTLSRLGRKADVRAEPFARLYLDGYEITDMIQLFEEGGFTGRVRLNVGLDGHKRSFPQRANGEFNYTAAALHLITQETLRSEQRRRQQAMALNEAALRRVNKAMQTEVGSVRGLMMASHDPDKPIHFELKIDLTEDDAIDMQVLLEGLLN